MSETLEEVTARHKKELKSFEGEKRAAIKNAKSRGKKGKSALKDAEFKYDAMERDLKARHGAELEQLSGGEGGDGGGDGNGGDDSGVPEEAADGGEKADAAKEETTSARPPTPEEAQQTPEQVEEARRQKALQKKLQKKNSQRQKEIEREKRIQDENASAGPSRRQMEMEALQALYLHPRGLDVREVEADGNCLYRAVGAQCRRLGLEGAGGEDCHVKIREMCADVLMGSNRAEFEPFAECGEGHAAAASDGGNHPATYDEYVRNVRSTSTWGGQLELRALSEGLKCPIVVFSAEGPPLTMGAEHAPGGEEDGEGDWSKRTALLLSFHRHYYALGEHYNSVVPK